jgi:formate dehydrogenase major subunit
MIKLTIDERSVSVAEGTSVLEAARSAGADIPTLCWLEGLPASGACRICLVEIQGHRGGIAAACSTPAAEGMIVLTTTPEVRKLRAQVLELIMATHPADCFNCRKNGACELLDYCREYGVTKVETGLEIDSFAPDTSHPFFNLDRNKCILCGRCVRVCNELQVSHVLDFGGRGQTAHIMADLDVPLGESTCVSCGNCVSYCPVGALLPKPKTWPGAHMVEKRTRTICGYCGVGCELVIETRGNKVVGVQPSRGPANEGILCVKGKFAWQFIGHPDRLTSPLLRKEGELVPVSWKEALDVFEERLRATLAQGGPSSVAGLSSARCTNEENYLFQKFFRAAVGTNNIDHCARLCHASSVTGLSKTLGSAAMSGAIADIELADLIFVTGSNTTETHPVIGARIKRAVEKGATLIVAEPRRIDLAAHAEVFLRINPGSNIALFNSMAQVLIAEGLVARDFIKTRTEGYDELAAFLDGDSLKRWSPERAAPICGVEPEEIRRIARLYAKAKNASVYYAMGVTQFHNGTDGVVALSNLALLAGQLGRPGASLNPLRGQNNVQGACDMGALPDVLPGYRKVADPASRAAVAKVWGRELPVTPGLTATELMDEALEGKIGFMYVMGENGAVSDPDLARTKKAFEKVGFLVVQDLFLTETASLADLILPAACFAEKEGTFANTERRVQRVRKAVEAPGEAKTDLEILAELLARFGLPLADPSPEAVFRELASVTPIYAGMSYARLDKSGLQWPCPSPDHPGTVRLYTEAFSRGKGRLIPVEWTALSEPASPEYPLTLTTGRLLYQYHTRTMTGKSPGLDRIAGRARIEISPRTAADADVFDGELVRLRSRRGFIEAEARVSDRTGDGVVFLPFHFVEAAANLLTSAEGTDPESRIPEFKATAVRLEKIEALEKIEVTMGSGRVEPED